ncbi:MAG: class I SAM-dependent methyltransferase [Leptolyngbyaceae cyanobacterium SM1_1_3]|nr:class I SAM-dependent methyltransferase [Leptolyngbyaceae cyanobacterium SM1_1_3]NJN01187.1 class I SAM-dependent methyltransferase [Leptolyngbyaceae cyanobacterium RM1_1_2]NJO09033.1 class I SAM-dependent methyltransferase [Leptolyngbyaceae cyanobacterium SL_1_1]
MELALYQPEWGYYASQDPALGPAGDFVTSPHLGHDFGELIAVQLAEFWHCLDRPKPFSLVEMGAGQGLVAADVLSALQQNYSDCFAAVEYMIVEKSAALIQEQQQRLQPWQNQVTLQWRSLPEIPPNSITGCFFSNELVDAFPVHRVVLTETGLQEIYVGLADSPSLSEPTFQDVQGPLSTPKLSGYFDLVGVAIQPPRYPIGYQSEINLAALDWIETVARKLQRGYLLTIDYGYPASRYYGPSRSQGTLQGYYRHAHHNDPYAHIGHQDLTAHVDFTGLERWGQQCGLEKLEATQQALFLMALGLGDRLSALAETPEIDRPTVQTVLRRRDLLHRLIDPMGLGNFGVLLQAKGLSADERGRSLKGFTVPPLL